MKNILVTLFIVVIMSKSFSQELNSISVMGESAYSNIEIKDYFVTLQIKEIKSDGYSQMIDKSLEEVTTEYQNKLSKNNIDFNKFEENKVLFFHSSYHEPGKTIYYTYKTNSETELTNLISTKASGVSILNIEASYKKLSSDKYSELSINAIKNAKEKALKIAEKLDKKLGEIISIDDSNYNLGSYNYYGKNINTYSVKVNFKLL